MAGYSPKTYRKQGGDEFVVASGGVITVESGGAFTNAGTITNSGVIVSSTAGAYNYDPVMVQNTTAALIPSYGTSLIGSTGTGALAYNLKKPSYAGQRKTLIVRNSTGGLTVQGSSAVAASTCKFRRTKTKITFGAASDNTAIDLVAETSTSWSIVGWSTAWTTTVKCT